MSDEKQLTIHFNNGTKMEVAFPAQIRNSTAAIQEGIKRILDSDKLVIETDRQVVVIPWCSVKYLESRAVGTGALPFGAIKGARIETDNEAPPLAKL